MSDSVRKLCLFLFLAAILSTHASPLATLTASLAGAVLAWPFYKKYAPPPPQRGVVIEPAEPDGSGH